MGEADHPAVTDTWRHRVAAFGRGVLGRGVLGRGVLGPLRDDPPAIAVLGAAVGFLVVFGRLVVMRHHRFATVDYDLAIHDQSLWLVARGHWFTTVRGLAVFGHHATFGYLLLAPLSWLGAGPDVLNLLQVLALAATAPILYSLGRTRFKRGWPAAALAVAWLLQPPVQYFAWETFHPEVIAIPFLAGAYLAAVEKRWRSFAVLVALTLIWKEDLSLAIVGLGLVLLIRRQPKAAAATMAAGALWFAIIGAWLVPHLAGGGTVYGPLYGDLGTSPGAVAKTALRDPGKVLQRLDDNDALGYARDLLAPTAFVPLAAPATLLIGAPQAAINLLSTANFTWDLRYHYQAIPMTATALGMVEGVTVMAAWFRRRHADTLRPFGAGLACAAALAGTCAWGPSPIGVRYRTGIWPLLPAPEQGPREHAMALIPGGDGVSCDYNFSPHLSHRQYVYTFPNPWQNKYYGITHSAHGDPAKVQWLAVDTRHFGEPELKLYEQLVDPDTGSFAVVYEDGPIVVAKRRRADPVTLAPAAGP